MRLTAGGFRELHWHTAGEWAIMLYGNARITAIDLDGKSFVADVGKNDLWFFPSGIPHSIQGLNPDGTSRPGDLVYLLFSRPNCDAASNFAQAYSAFKSAMLRA
jgi:hypothetical protein